MAGVGGGAPLILDPQGVASAAERQGGPGQAGGEALAVGPAQLDLQRAVAHHLSGCQPPMAGDVGEEQGEGGALERGAQPEQIGGGLVGQGDAAILEQDQAGLRIARHQAAQQPIGLGAGGGGDPARTRHVRGIRSSWAVR